MTATLTPPVQVANLFLVGSPNVGKTSIYNSLTNSCEKEVNYPGSTVATAKKPLVIGDSTYTIHDTPGLSSIRPTSQDERITWDLLYEASSKQDMALFVIDPLQLGKELVLFRQLQRVFQGGILLVINYGCCSGHIQQLDEAKLASSLQVPILTIFARNQGGMQNLSRDLQEKLSQAQARGVQSSYAFSSTPQIARQPARSEQEIHEDFQWAERLVQRVVQTENTTSSAQDSFLDKLFFHPVLGSLLFVLIMGGFFWSLFGLATPFMDGIDVGVTSLQEYLSLHLPESTLSTFIVEGVLTGVGASLVFVPQIILLFIGLGIMEQSGFLARGAVLIDRPLALLGLSGRSFLPLLSGFACAIPAFLAARNIPHKRERTLVQFMIPLMACSARLPVYGLLISLLLFNYGGWAKAAMMTGVYIITIMLASLVAWVLSRSIPQTKLKETPFHLSLPAWRKPEIGRIMRSALVQAGEFVWKAGPHILWISLLLWGISNYPSPEHSLSLQLGKWLEPIFLPMGIDWRVGVSLLFAFAAREVFVSALLVAFSFSQAGNSFEGVVPALSQATFEGGGYIFTISSTLGLIAFFMVSMQCLSTVAVARKEMQGWKLPLLMMASYTVGGYLLAVLIVQGLRFMGVP